MSNNGSSNVNLAETQRIMKLLVVDEHPTMRLGIRRAIEDEKGMLVVGETSGAEETLRLVEELHPDAVVMDLTLRGEVDGIGLLRELQSLPHAPSIVVYTAHNSQEDVFLSRLAGADSFVYKGEETVRLIEALKETHSGKRVWFLGEERRGPARPPALGNADEPRLTPREKEVFSFLIRRYSNAEISRELCIGLQTVKNHVSNVLKKLGAEKRADLL